MAFIRLSSGHFVVLDTIHVDEDLKVEIDALTDKYVFSYYSISQRLFLMLHQRQN